MKKKIIRWVFILLIPFLFLQFAFAVIVREPFPGIMMPGFAGVHWESDLLTYEEFRIQGTWENDQTSYFPVMEVFKDFSLFGSRRLLEFAFFSQLDSETSHPLKAKLDSLLVNTLGENTMNNLIKPMRKAEISPSDIEKFEAWLVQRIQTLDENKARPKSVIISKVDITQHIITKEILKEVEKDKVMFSTSGD